MNRFLWLAVGACCLVGPEAEGQLSRRRVLLPALQSEGAARIETGVFMGVMSVRAPEEVAAQLGLAAGFGLMVEDILPGSPAERAGIKRHDVLLAFDDQELVNPEQLLALVRRSKKGRSVEMTVLSQAARRTVTVVLDEGPVEILSKSPGLVPAEVLAEAGEGEAVAQGRSAKRLLRRDESGEYELSVENGVMNFSADPKEGVGGTWPVDTDEQKQRVPVQFQDKLKALFKWLEAEPYAGFKVSG